MTQISNDTQAKAPIKHEVREKMVGYFATAIGIVVGLAWNDAVSALIEGIFPVDKNSISAKFAYAVILTVAVVIFSGYAMRLMAKNRE